MSTHTTEPLAETPLVPRAAESVFPVAANHQGSTSSSSLSDPGDRSADEDAAQGIESREDNIVEDLDGASDTEAETERLEKTPRKRRNVLLTEVNAVLHDQQDAQDDQDLAPKSRQSSELSNQSSDDAASHLSKSPSRKRKRSSFETSKVLRNGRRDDDDTIQSHSNTPSPDGSEGSAEDKSEEENGEASPDENENGDYSPISRRRKQIVIEDAEVNQSTLNAEHDYGEELDDPEEAVSSNGEEVDVDDAGEGDAGDAESTIKTEENMIKKKSAMNSLSAIENCFATLRDRLFDERLAQCQEELAMLERPQFIHPELMMMKEVIDRRRDQKTQYEQTLLKFKLETLERESIAEKAQIHTQYMQTVGGLRDSSLAHINKAIYQTQRERRNCEADISDYMYEFTPKRSQQVTQQTAYNEEVSLLSGMAKYVGFPAAPGTAMAKSKEFEDDRRMMDQNMAAADQALNILHNQPPMLRASLSAASTFGRLQSGPEDQFLQQNAWANPQHPVHQLHRQISVLSQAENEGAVSTPANSKSALDQLQDHGSTSTIVEPQSELGSYLAPTPATAEGRDKGGTVLSSGFLQRSTETTPSRIAGSDPVQENPANLPKRAQLNAAASSQISDIDSGGLSHKDAMRDSASEAGIPKPLPFIQGGSGSRGSAPARYPVIKAEDTGIASRHSPVSHHFSHSPSISAETTGPRNRIST